MKALYWVGENKVELIDAPEPQVGPGLAKVKVAYCALCATDFAQVYRHMYGPFIQPTGLGHEASGTIVELGEGMAEQGWKIGDKICCSGYAPCGVCDNCKRGDDVYCRNMFSYPKLAEYTLCKSSQMFKIPENVEDIRPYCLAEPSASAMRGIDLSDIKIGDNVAISGVGGIGSILLNMILLKGSTRVTVIDPIKEKRERALEMGADFAIDPTSENLVERSMELTDGRGYDKVFDASGSPAAAPPLLDMISNKGTAIYFAVYPQDYELPVNLFKLYLKEGRIQTVYTTNYNYPRVVELIPKLQMDKIIGIEYPITKAVEAWNSFRTSIYPKIVINCQKFE